ncbi:MAG: hypothetical protein HS115_17930 [Spirochaetales bacterium]|nr:hypothetical protein [Spirochaetales bacterium]
MAETEMVRRFWPFFALVFSIITLWAGLELALPLLLAKIPVFFNESGTVRLSWQIKKASVYRGIHLENLRLTDVPTGEDIVRVKELRLRTFLTGLLVRKPGLPELTLKKPELRLVRTAQGWNTDRLLGPPATEEPTASRTHIPFYLPVQIFASIKVEDASFLYRDGEDFFVDHLDLDVRLIFTGMTDLPLGMEILDRLSFVQITLGPRPLALNRNGRTPLQGNALLYLLIHKQLREATDHFQIDFQLDTRELLIAGQPFPLFTRIAGHYEDPSDRFVLPVGQVRMGAKDWLLFSGHIHNARQNVRVFDVNLTQTQADLSELRPLFQALEVPGISGRVVCGPMQIRGPLTRLDLTGQLEAQAVHLQTGNLQHRLDLKTALDARMNFAPSGPEEKLAFGIFHSLNLPELKASYNQAQIHGRARITRETGVEGDLTLKNFRIDPYAPGVASGALGADLRFRSPDDFSRIATESRLYLTGLRYYSDRSRSAPLNVRARLTGIIQFLEKTTLLELQKFSLTAQDLRGQQALQLTGQARTELTADAISGDTDLNIFSHFPVLYQSLPGNLKDSLADLTLYFSRGIGVKTRQQFTSGKQSSIKGTSVLNIPFLNLTDLSLKESIRISEDRLTIEELELVGLGRSLSGRARGSLGLGQKLDPDLDVALKVFQPRKQRIHRNLVFGGSFALEGNWKKDRIGASLDIRDLELTYDSCQASGCSDFTVQKINTALALVHDLSLPVQKTLESRVASPTLGLRPAANLTIGSIHASHSPRGERMPARYYYLGSAREKGLEAFMEYRQNTLSLPWLVARIFHHSDRKPGVISAENAHIYLADFNAARMAVQADARIAHLNLEPYLPYSRSQYNGIISADFHLQSRGLDRFLENATMRVSIYDLSREFSGFATRVVMPEKLAAVLVNNLISIPSIKVELKEGLVYSAVSLQRASLLSNLVATAQDEVRQDRIPLARFLESSQSAVRDFNETQLLQ